MAERYHLFLVWQTEFYLGLRNLPNDQHLLNHMDIDGWIKLKVVMDLSVIKILTEVFKVDAIELGEILLKYSERLEVNPDMPKVRSKWWNALRERYVTTPSMHINFAMYVSQLESEAKGLGTCDGPRNAPSERLPILFLLTGRGQHLVDFCSFTRTETTHCEETFVALDEGTLTQDEETSTTRKMDDSSPESRHESLSCLSSSSTSSASVLLLSSLSPSTCPPPPPTPSQTTSASPPGSPLSSITGLGSYSGLSDSSYSSNSSSSSRADERHQNFANMVSSISSESSQANNPKVGTPESSISLEETATASENEAKTSISFVRHISSQDKNTFNAEAEMTKVCDAIFSSPAAPSEEIISGERCYLFPEYTWIQEIHDDSSLENDSDPENKDNMPLNATECTNEDLDEMIETLRADGSETGSCDRKSSGKGIRCPRPRRTIARRRGPRVPDIDSWLEFPPLPGRPFSLAVISFQPMPTAWTRGPPNALWAPLDDDPQVRNWLICRCFVDEEWCIELKRLVKLRRECNNCRRRKLFIRKD